MKVLVTGAAGSIGSKLIHHIQETHPGWEILGIDNYSTGKKENKADGMVLLEMNTWDVNRIITTRDFNPDIVFHFGEYSKDNDSFDDRDYVMKSNLLGTSEVVRYCLKNNAKLIYSVNSKFRNNSEDENLNPYSWTKAKMVEMIKNYHSWFELQYEIFYSVNREKSLKDWVSNIK